jgi:hypothetical protein
MKITPKFAIAGAILVGLMTTASSCTDGEWSSSTNNDEKISESMLQDFQKAQPVPTFKYSQYRENLIDIVTAQAQPTPTTTFFFNAGVADPVYMCASVGFPIPGTSQLTNPEKIEDRYEGDVAIPQVEPNGVFTGDTTNTTTICRDANGRGYAVGWEGFTMPVTGPAEWNSETKQVELIGAPTGEFSTGE